MARVYVYDCDGEIMQDIVLDPSFFNEYEKYLTEYLEVNYDIVEVDGDVFDFADAYVVDKLQVFRDIAGW